MSKARTIWKFEIPISDDRHMLNIPYCKPLLVALQSSIPCLWTEVQPGWPSETHAFQWFGTGDPIPDDCEHVGSLPDGPFVWHLYRYV